VDRTRIPCYTDPVANLTISVDDDVLKRARIRALEHGTSVNAVLAEYLRAFAGQSETQRRAVQSLLGVAAENTRRGGRARAKQRGGRRWKRDDLHER
jgi:plasmid stability protein